MPASWRSVRAAHRSRDLPAGGLSCERVSRAHRRRPRRGRRRRADEGARDRLTRCSWHPACSSFVHHAKEAEMEERKVVEKRTEIERDEPVVPGTKNVNVNADGSTQVQESNDVVDEPIGATTVRKETTVEERRGT